MKVYIVGPSCVGKTTMARVMSKKFKVSCYDLDEIFIDWDLVKDRGVLGFVPKKIVRKRIDNILKENKDWIIEGVFLVKEIFEKADRIIFIRRFVLTPLFWQWKRFVSEEKQRKVFGFWLNFGLSLDILRQYYTADNNSRWDDETYFSVVKTKKWLSKYRNKVAFG